MIPANKFQKLKFYLNLTNPLIDRKVRVCRTYGRTVYDHLVFLERSQWWTPEELEVFQNDKLKRLIRHVYENIPYYRELFARNNLAPGDIRTAEDLHKIPVLTKYVIRKNFPDRMLAGGAEVTEDNVRRTGASTGEPLVFCGDYRSFDIAWASFLRFYQWIGYEWGDKEARVWGFPIITDGRKAPIHQRAADWLYGRYVPNRRYFDAFNMDEEKLGEYAAELSRYKPHILRGYVSAVTSLADYCRKNNINGIRPKAITTTAEMLHSSDRKLLQKQFSSDVFDQYACGECLGVAYECKEHKGMHITAEHCVVEILDEHKDETMPAGERGRIAITDLDNYVMPFIRYVNGDVGRLKKEICGCGRGLPLMDYAEGRITDMIRGANGNVVHGEFFTHLLEEMGWLEQFGVRNFEAVQKDRNGIHWYLVCDTRPGQQEISELISLCRRYLGNMNIEVHFVENIQPTPSGKRRFTRSEVTAGS
ncbi:MAG TPA: phenylacetate--CoA ligase family protein [Nitrospirae bacterium]|nr:phenylacetate-coenzyme A ligase [bacterium BMS3Abin10]GBE39562.1 phenylacetate-coenzyme A ligase [bacterium BMS3Bbin08]HDK82581.1 phenylacetate--CoA ligase family protein [Nitrospirota bacterium]